MTTITLHDATALMVATGYNAGAKLPRAGWLFATNDRGEYVCTANPRNAHAMFIFRQVASGHPVGPVTIATVVP